MPNVVQVGQEKLLEDYRGSVADNIMQHVQSGGYVSLGDKEKATKAIYEVVVGKGVGAGHEKESLLPLGTDLARRVGQVRDRLDHMMEVFGDVCMNVGIDRQEQSQFLLEQLHSK